MAGQPLAWMEASNLPEEAFEISSIVKGYREIMHEFHNGTILPIGQEPSGRSWTGFQSITSPDEGFLLLYRELTPDDESTIPTWLPDDRKVKFTRVIGNGRSFSSRILHNGHLKVRLDKPNDFVLYKYKISK